MKTVIQIIFIVLAIGGTAFSQATADPSCPMISVEGIVHPGELSTFVVRVDTKGKQLSLVYEWLVSAGEIVSGQGTDTIKVRQPDEAVTATVELYGLAAGCPNTASESIVIDYPSAEPLDEFRPPISTLEEYRVRKIVEAANANPNGQIYILSSHAGGKASNVELANERNTLEFLERRGIPRSKVTIVSAYSRTEWMQVSLIPPGAPTPRCEECEELERERSSQICPAISMSGPSGIVDTGEVARYVAQIDTKGQQLSLVYEWSVSAGEIVSGQGTDTIEVRQPDKAVTATVVIGGLPEVCPNAASESTCGLSAPQPIKLAEIEFPLSAGDKNRLKNALEGLRDNPNDIYFIFIRYRTKTRLQGVKNQILSKINFDHSPRITFVEVKDNRNYLQIWRVPPGADPPTP